MGSPKRRCRRVGGGGVLIGGDRWPRVLPARWNAAALVTTTRTKNVTSTEIETETETETKTGTATKSETETGTMTATATETMTATVTETATADAALLCGRLDAGATLLCGRLDAGAARPPRTCCFEDVAAGVRLTGLTPQGSPRLPWSPRCAVAT